LFDSLDEAESFVGEQAQAWLAGRHQLAAAPKEHAHG